ncbi:hypothetical protein CWI54_27455, partial [Escherichia coli]
VGAKVNGGQGSIVIGNSMPNRVTGCKELLNVYKSMLIDLPNSSQSLDSLYYLIGTEQQTTCNTQSVDPSEGNKHKMVTVNGQT